LRAATDGAAQHRPIGYTRSGWKDILARVRENIGEHRVIAIAAGVTFYVILPSSRQLLRLSPFMGFFASIVDTIERIEDSLVTDQQPA